METINPSDINQLDFETISFITLKNGESKELHRKKFQNRVRLIRFIL